MCVRLIYILLPTLTGLFLKDLFVYLCIQKRYTERGRDRDLLSARSLPRWQQPVLDQAKTRSQELVSFLGVAGTQTPRPPSTDFPRPLTGSCIGSGTAGTQTVANTGCQSCRQLLYLPRHNVDPHPHGSEMFPTIPPITEYTEYHKLCPQNLVLGQAET